MKLSNETKESIIKDIESKLSIKDICNKYNISHSTYFRIKKNVSVLSDISQSKINSDKQSNNDSNNNSNENDSDSNENESDGNEEEKGESESEEEESNEDEINESNNIKNKSEKAKIDIKESSFINKLNGNDISTLSNNKKLNVSTMSKKSNKSVSFIKKSKKEFSFNQKESMKETILDTVKNINHSGSIEELKEIRHHVIIIRQYITTFQKELSNFYGGNRQQFEKRLFNMSIDQLKVILENIRVEMNLSKNRQIFKTVIETGLRAFEKTAIYSGYDIDGLTNELLQNEDFKLDLDIISCECDISRYINPKTSAFLTVMKTMYQKKNENEIKKQVNNLLNDNDKLDKIKNLKIA